MREPLTGVTVVVGGTPVPGSTTIAAVGAYVLVLATALPDHALTLTSSYLVRQDGAMATSHLTLSAGRDDFAQHVVPGGQLHATIAGACLLHHAATLRDVVEDATGVTVGVDVDPDALERVAQIWGPPPPPG